MSVERRPFRMTALTPRDALPIARGLGLGLLLVVGACSSSSHSTQLGTGSTGGTGGSTSTMTYSIGGSITGLGTSTGLVLANGSATVSVAAGMSTFTFPTAVASGTAYAVSVQSSPSGLTCTAAGGSGTVQTANITSISVTCATTPYTLGGSVSGLTAAGLTLANGTDTFNVPSGATSFAMPTKVAPTSSYNVAVQAEPMSGPYCSVANGSGTMPASNVNSVAVTCSTQPFTVSGTITGLNGSGLVLANGSTTVSVNSGATSFSIPVAFNTQYTIGVQTPATGVSCAVTHNTGTMPAGNVTGVVVTCSDQSYQITGNISGLTSGSITMASGSVSTTVASGTSSYSLSVPYGSPYNVVVQTPPSGLTCSVVSTQGSAMPAHAVTGADVSCSPTAYSIGGSISGLHAGGMVLLNTDNSDTRTVPSNATSFTMPLSVNSGSSYHIQIQTQPTMSYSCSINSGTGSGTVTTSNVTSVAITCTQNPTWAYAPDYNNALILQYAVDNSTHLLGSSPIASFAAGGNTPIFVTVNAANTVLYSVNRDSNNVTWYTIDPSNTGALTAQGTIGTGGYTPLGLVFNAAGTVAFVPNYGITPASGPNPGIPGSIAVFDVNSDGSLTPWASSPVLVTAGSQLAQPKSVTLHPTLSQLYVTDFANGTVVNYSIDTTNKVLTLGASAAAESGANSMVINPSASYAYVGTQYGYGGSVLVYGVDGSGVLSQLGYSAVGQSLFDIAMDPSGLYLYTANNSSTSSAITEFAIDQSSGLLGTAIGTAPGGSSTATVQVDPISGLVYSTSNGDYTQSISEFTITQGSGVLVGAGAATSPSTSAVNSVVFANP